MAGVKTEFDQFIAEEIERNRGVMVPARASWLERFFVRKARTEKLHPNPDDEFCDPAVGPNSRIIAEYVQTIVRTKSLQPSGYEDPIVVEKVRPDGYMILNGHHRWAAALQTGFNPLPISIVNLTQETDIEQMVRNSKHDRRVTLDLDEVVFCKNEEEAEKPLIYPFNRIFRERIRRGVPALLHFLSRQGYDIWVYTAQYYSIEYIRAYFKKYTVKIDGIITGSARKSISGAEARKRMKQLVDNQYVETIHIDHDTVLRTQNNTGTFEEFAVNTESSAWSVAVMDIIKQFGSEEQKQ